MGLSAPLIIKKNKEQFQNINLSTTFSFLFFLSFKNLSTTFEPPFASISLFLSRFWPFGLGPKLNNRKYKRGYHFLEDNDGSKWNDIDHKVSDLTGEQDNGVEVPLTSSTFLWKGTCGYLPRVSMLLLCELDGENDWGSFHLLFQICP